MAYGCIRLPSPVHRWHWAELSVFVMFVLVERGLGALILNRRLVLHMDARVSR